MVRKLATKQQCDNYNENASAALNGNNRKDLMKIVDLHTFCTLVLNMHYFFTTQCINEQGLVWRT